MLSLIVVAAARPISLLKLSVVQLQHASTFLENLLTPRPSGPAVEPVEPGVTPGCWRTPAMAAVAAGRAGLSLFMTAPTLPSPKILNASCSFRMFMYLGSQYPDLKPVLDHLEGEEAVVAVEHDREEVRAEHRMARGVVDLREIQLREQVGLRGEPRLDARDDPGRLELRHELIQRRVVVRRILGVLADLLEQLLVPVPDRRRVVEGERAKDAVRTRQGLQRAGEEVVERTRAPHGVVWSTGSRRRSPKRGM